MTFTSVSHVQQGHSLPVAPAQPRRTDEPARSTADALSLRFSSSSTRLASRLDPFLTQLAGEPDLLRGFLAIVELLEGFDEEVAERFLARIAEALGIGDGVRGDREAVRAEFRRLDIRFEAVSLSDGSVERVRVSIEVEALAVLSRRGEPKKIDPIVLDLDGDGLRISGLEDGVVFDLDADGQLDLSAFVHHGDGLLALDRNANGRIDDGAELFGDQRGAVNGFEELRKLDTNGDGVVDRFDPLFSNLGVVVRGPDGFGFRHLDEVGVESISLDYRDEYSPLHADAVIAQRGLFTRSDGSVGLAADVLLAAQPLDR